MDSDLESGNRAYGEIITYVAISPDGSLVATFNPYGSSISITKLKTNEKSEIRFDRKKFLKKKPRNILGWSLAVSNIIENDIGLIAISCITEKDMNTKKIEKISYFSLIKQIYTIYRKSSSSSTYTMLNYLIYSNIIIILIKSPLLSLLWFIFVPFYIFYLTELLHPYKISKRDKQFQLSSSPSEGMIKLFKFSFNNDSDDNYNNDISLYKCRLGGIVKFLNNSKNSLDDSIILVCMNCIKIHKFNIKLNKKVSILKECTYLLPENLFKKLESFDDSRRNWEYLLRSGYQEFLMVDTSNNQQTQSIEMYDINTSQLVNVFYRSRGEKDYIISRNNEPGIFAISTDSKLFAYSYGDNIITIYLMESGLEIISKKFDNIYKIKFLEFIEKDKKLLIIDEDEEYDMKFHLWIISGRLNNYFSIARDDLPISSKYDDYEYYNTLTKVNGKVVFYNRDYKDQFRVLQEITIKKIIFGENYVLKDETNEHKYNSYDLEPWNDNVKPIDGKFLNNDKSTILIIGQNSIQVWKSKFTNFEDFEDFKNFKNSYLVYILIYEDTEPVTTSEFQIEDNMITIITHACKSLAYLYKHTDSIYSKEKNQKFVSAITNIIKDFIKNYPDNWKLMEIQYPLMAYLIYSRSFSLIKYILFGDNNRVESKNAGLLHRPQKKYGSYPCYDDLKLYDDLGFEDNDLRSTNDLELALKFCQNEDAVMLAYLLEYYSENSMNHIGWMINVTKILPELSKHNHAANYAKLLYYKPCFGEMKYNFPNKWFQVASYSQDTLKVYVPLTNLIPTNSFDIFLYKKVRNDDICMVPLANFTTYNSTIKEKIEGEADKGRIERFIHFLRVLILPPGYKNLDDKDFSPFLQIKKSEISFYEIPAMEATINARWLQAMVHQFTPFIIYSVFLIIFSSCSQYYSSFNHMSENIIRIAVFYYTGIYLLMIEFLQMKKYKSSYFTIFKIFDLLSIILGIIVITIIFEKEYFGINRVSNEDIIVFISSATLVLWIEMLLQFRLFSVVATNIFIFGNILRKIIPFFAFMFILMVGFGQAMFVLFNHRSLFNLYPSASNFMFTNGTANITLVMTSQDNPFSTVWDSILSTYYWNTIDLNTYDSWPLKLFAFITNIILVLVLFNMIIALMNDTFNKAKEDARIGLLMHRVKLINDFERLDISPLYKNDFPYICFHKDTSLMKNWLKKSQKFREEKLYSWFNENVDEEKITFDNGIDIKSWYETLISGNEN
ncbi:unnamed protein product [Rhizophagus irregularis]|uniref:Ion transport domain-containing protein n=1 Tax=Rhizophagus irregularis TaxID=588596 RepID=A0A915YVQ9_9GLOM|nr:unnamed protein product [Rhizophagus irregularis]